MHEVEAKSLLTRWNGMNIYRGCTHGCIYCDSRSSCYHMDHRFEDVEVKRNAPELLERTLRSRRKKCMISTGSMSDPYQPLEKDLQLTRRCLEVISRYGFGATVITKSDMVLRDLTLLQDINHTSKAVVQMTLTTADEALCRIVEPNVCTTRDRWSALKTLADSGIPTVVWFCPVLPYINDTEENVRGIVEMCAQAHVHGILWFGAQLTLRDGDREYYYQKLDRHFPGLKDRYIRKFGNAYAVKSKNAEALNRLFYELCDRYGIESDSRKLFRYTSELDPDKEPRQLSLFDL